MENTLPIIPETFHLVGVAGDDLGLLFEILDDNDDPIILSTYTVDECFFYNGTTKVALTITRPDNYKINIACADTLTLSTGPIETTWSFSLIEPGGIIRTYLDGKFILRKRARRR